MGSICDVAEEVIDYLTAHGEKVGLVKVRLFRPFRADKLVAAVPETAKKIAKADIEHALTELDSGKYGMILRSKGIVDGGADGWLEFDYVPGEWEVRSRGADVGGKLVVIGSKLDEKAIAGLFGC